MIIVFNNCGSCLFVELELTCIGVFEEEGKLEKLQKKKLKGKLMSFNFRKMVMCMEWQTKRTGIFI
jgi:hypothetical protein